MSSSPAPAGSSGRHGALTTPHRVTSSSHCCPLPRAAQAVLVLLVATLAIFLATFALGDPFASTGEKVVPPEVQAIDRAKFGLDQPLPVQYLTYLSNLVHLDFGVDFDQHRPVSSMLAETLP